MKTTEKKYTYYVSMESKEGDIVRSTEFSCIDDAYIEFHRIIDRETVEDMFDIDVMLLTKGYYNEEHKEIIEEITRARI